MNIKQIILNNNANLNLILSTVILLLILLNYSKLILLSNSLLLYNFHTLFKINTTAAQETTLLLPYVFNMYYVFIITFSSHICKYKKRQRKFNQKIF
ncbi:hypothetical protein BGAFAR04_Ab0003 (plasmid) [Borreliella garinii Far04]|nr:hypothetical protein BGAFAR04_Ab0003 [Borreliella garinii Far04]